MQNQMQTIKHSDGTGGFIKQQRSDDVLELARDPYAFTLLGVIAQRARRTGGFSVLGLKPGEALIGDYEAYGMTEQRYRTAKKHLEEWGLATFKATNKGTVARLANTRIYDINLDAGNDQTNDQLTTEQRSINDQLTTNKNGRMEEWKSERGKRTRFVKPLADEVTRYARSIGYELDGQYFIDTYETKGWMVGKSPMKDWRAAVRTWKRRDAEQAKPKQDDVGTDPDEADRIFEQIRMEKMAS